MDDNVAELALALATAIKARLPQLELGGLAADLAHSLRGGGGLRRRSDDLLAQVSGCPFARLPVEIWLGQAAGEEAMPVAGALNEAPHARRVRSQTRPLGRRAIGARAAGRPPPRR